LPPPEWFEEFRLLHVHYGQEYETIVSMAVSQDEKDRLSTTLWVETDQARKPDEERPTLVAMHGREAGRPAVCASCQPRLHRPEVLVARAAHP
jgi:hypothetical protein